MMTRDACRCQQTCAPSSSRISFCESFQDFFFFFWLTMGTGAADYCCFFRGLGFEVLDFFPLGDTFLLCLGLLFSSFIIFRDFFYSGFFCFFYYYLRLISSSWRLISLEDECEGVSSAMNDLVRRIVDSAAEFR